MRTSAGESRQRRAVSPQALSIASFSAIDMLEPSLDASHRRSASLPARLQRRRRPFVGKNAGRGLRTRRHHAERGRGMASLRRYPECTLIADLGRCEDCGTAGGRIMLDGQPHCDARKPSPGRRHGLARAASATPAEVVIGPDRRRHFIRYRLVRWPMRVVAVASTVRRAPPAPVWRSIAATSTILVDWCRAPKLRCVAQSSGPTLMRVGQPFPSGKQPLVAGERPGGAFVVDSAHLPDARQVGEGSRWLTASTEAGSDSRRVQPCLAQRHLLGDCRARPS